MRIRELANETHVSTTTILRFCKKFGCNGFSEFKTKLKIETSEEKNIKIKTDNSVILDFLERTQGEKFQYEVNEAIKIINNVNQIFCIGFGHSGSISKYAARYIASVGRFALDVSDPFYPIKDIYIENGVSIIFSVSGETLEIIDYANRVKRSKGKVVSITNSKNCTLARLSDCNINYYMPESMNGTYQLTTQIPAVYIIEYIAKNLK